MVGGTFFRYNCRLPVLKQGASTRFMSPQLLQPRPRIAALRPVSFQLSAAFCIYRIAVKSLLTVERASRSLSAQVIIFRSFPQTIMHVIEALGSPKWPSKWTPFRVHFDVNISSSWRRHLSISLGWHFSISIEQRREIVGSQERWFSTWKT